MFQTLLSPIRSRFDTVRLQHGDTSGQTFSATNDVLQGASLLSSSPRSPLASPALSVFGAHSLPPSNGRDQEDMANAEEFARDVLVELMRDLLGDFRTRVSGNGNGISQDDVQAQIKVGLLC
jgi:hypothetical protein